MMELPEAMVIAGQLDETVAGKRIKEAAAGTTPHKFAWYYGDPGAYGALLRGRLAERAAAYGGRGELSLEGGVALHMGEGANLRYFAPGEPLPAKHQLLVTFDDGAALVGTVAMYGLFAAFPEGAMDDNFYYMAAKQAVPPLSAVFDYAYFQSLLDPKARKMSAKAFLATQQRIPGLGNGVLQDILLCARIHPRRKMDTLTEERTRGLFDSMKSTLSAMTEAGGRDTERDLFGNPGNYRTKLCRNTAGLCPVCGDVVKKEAYLGGSVYYCERCQPLNS